MHGYPHPVMFERTETDVIFSQRQVDDQHIAAIERLRRLTDCRIIMDFDDLLTQVPDYSHHKQRVWQDIDKRLERLCRSAHRVTVSTEQLADHFRKLHNDVRIIPNALDERHWGKLSCRRRRSDRPRVGWAGGLSHAGDLAVIREVVRELADDVEWVFLGMCLEDMLPHLTEFHRGVSFADYPAKLASLDLDLALAPLAMNAFNESKSHLKLLEYGILGIPVIATDITPYQGDIPVTRLANQPKTWLKAIRDHMQDPDELARRGDALRQHVRDQWLLERQLPAWRAAWTDF
jgi:glycosyltransferase involved in cell wall biosynthesis